VRRSEDIAERAGAMHGRHVTRAHLVGSEHRCLHACPAATLEGACSQAASGGGGKGGPYRPDKLGPGLTGTSITPTETHRLFKGAISK